MTEYYYFDRIRKRYIGPINEIIESRSWRQYPSRLIEPDPLVRLISCFVTERNKGICR